MRLRKSIHLLQRAGTGALVLFLSTQSFAQEVDRQLADSRTIEEVVVVARKREESM